MENINPMRSISNKEVQWLIDRKERQARRLLRRISQKLGKADWQEVTIADFCQYQGYDLQHVLHILKTENKKAGNNNS